MKDSIDILEVPYAERLIEAQAKYGTGRFEAQPNFHIGIVPVKTTVRVESPGEGISWLVDLTTLIPNSGQIRAAGPGGPPLGSPDQQQLAISRQAFQVHYLDEGDDPPPVIDAGVASSAQRTPIPTGCSLTWSPQ